MDKIYDSSYSITLDINVKLENEPQLFDSTYSICMAIYNKLGGEETNFDSTYSIVEAILPLAGVEYVRPFDSTYSLCLAIYDKLGGEPAIFDSTYSILLGILPLVEPGPGPEPEPEPLDKDYFYFQPLSTGDYSVSSNDDVWKQKDTFEFRKANTNWRKFSSLAHQDTSVGFDVYMTNNPNLVALALDINAYNTYIVGQNYRVGISQMGPATVATFLGTDENFAYYTGTLEEPEMMDFQWGLMTATSTSLRYRSEYSEDRMFEWDGTSYSGTNTNISDYSSFNVVTTVITETIPLTANDKLYLRNTGGSHHIHSGIINSIQSVNYNIGGILNTLTDYTDDTYTITTSYADGLFKGDTHLISAGDLELPATTLADRCYKQMFYGCTALTTAPELPATTLANYCYNAMFQNCSSLTTAPELPATTLVANCYNAMFQNCTNLNYVKCLAKNVNETYTTWSQSMLDYWLWGVSASGTFYKSQGVDYRPDDRYGIPKGWTIIDEGGTVEYNYVKVDNSYIPEDKDIFVFMRHRSDKYYMFTNQQYNRFNTGSSNTNLMSTPSINVTNNVVSEKEILSINSVYYNGQTYTGAKPLIIVALKYTQLENTYEFKTVFNGSLQVNSNTANKINVYGDSSDSARWTFVNPGTNLLVKNLYYNTFGYLGSETSLNTNGTLTNSAGAAADKYLEIFKRVPSYV